MPDNLHREIIKVLGLPELTKLQKHLDQVANAYNKVTAATNQANQAKGLKTTVSREQVINGQRYLTTIKSVNGEVQEIELRQRRLNETTNEYIRSWGFLARVVAGSLIARGIGQLTTAFAQGTQDAREFEVRVGELRTISQEADLSFESWSDSIRQLSNEFARAPLDVLEGTYQALSNQIAEGAETTLFMREALRLALITTSTTEEAVLGLTAALNAYDLSADNARQVSNKLFKVIELGRIRFKEISGNIGQVLIVGKQLGLTLDDIGGALARLTIQGLNASKAQTGLRNVLLKLIRPTDAMKELFDEWGVSSGQAAIETFGFVGTLERLSEAAQRGNSDLTELGEFFGRIRAITGAAGLTSDLGDLQSSIDQVAAATDSADKALERATETIGFKLNKEINEIQNNFLKLGQRVNESIFTVGERLGGLSEIVEKITSTVVSLTKAIGAYVVIMGSARIATAIFTGEITLLTAAIARANALLTVFSFGASGLAVPIAAGFAVGAFAVDRYLNSLRNAQRSVSELATRHTQDLTKAFLETAVEENRILAERVQNNKEAFRQIQQDFGTAVAGQQAALNKLKKDEENRVEFENLLIDLQLKTASKRRKEEIIYQKLLDTRKNLLVAIRNEDFAAAKSAQQELLSFFSLYESVRGKISNAQKQQQRLQDLKFSLGIPIEVTGRGGQSRIDSLFNRTLKDIEKAYKDFEKRVGRLSEDQIDQTQKIIDKQVEQNKQINESAEAYRRTEETAASYNKQLKELTASIGGQVKAIEESVENQDILGNRLKLTIARLQDSLSESERELPLEIAIAAFRTELARLNSSIDETNSKDFIFDQVWVEGRLRNLERIKNSYAEIKNVLTIPDIEQSFSSIEAFFNALIPTVNQYEDINNKLKDMRINIQNATTASQSLFEIFNLSGETNLESIRAIENASQRVSTVQEAIAGKLQAIINQQVRSIELLRQQIQQVNQLQTQNQFKGSSYITRFAAGGSVGSDSIPALLAPGEAVLDRRATRQLFTQISALNSRAIGFNSGSSVTTNNNVGDININLESTGDARVDGRTIAKVVRRELNRGTARLN